jgi:hypothetical protein
MDARGVTFRTKDGKTVTVSAVAFLRRFLAHVLPRGFVKIRHYGLMAASHATTTLETARALLSKPVSAMDAPRDAEGARVRAVRFRQVWV